MGFPVLCFLCLVALVSARPSQEQAGLLPIELEDVLSGKLKPKSFNGTWLSDTKFAFKNENGDFRTYDVRQKKYDTLVTADEVKEFNITGFQVSPNNKFVLFLKDTIQLFRYSSKFRCFIYNLDTKDIIPVARDMPVQSASWVPHSSSLVYVRENNVFYQKSPADYEIPLTQDGVPGVKYNGIGDRIYIAEMRLKESAFWSSPDGLWLAIASFDDSNVDEVMYFQYGEHGTMENQSPELIQYRYPKVGRANPVVKVKIIRLADVEAPNITWTELPTPEDFVGSDNVLADVTWASNAELAVTWMNRRQNISVMQICQLDGSCKTELKTEEPRGWLNAQSPWFYSDGTRYLTVHSSKQPDGTTWPHLFGADIGSPPKPITSGYWTVMEILGLDSIRNHVFYMATTLESSAHREVFIAGSKNFSLTRLLYKDDGTRCNFGSADFSKNYSYAALTCNGPDPPQVILYDIVNEEIITTWEDNRALRDELSKFSKATTKDMMIDVPNGFQAQVRLWLPPGLDEENTAKKYPMIVNIYNAPESKKIIDVFRTGYRAYLTTNRQYIYCEIDARGTAYRSDELMFQLNNALGTVGIDDQIAVTRKLTKMFGFIDPERIGIWGWSYGGYATAMALIRDKDNVFKCGVSVGSVTSFLYCGTIYIERYMGTPAENPIGYNESDVVLHAEGLRDKRFLLLHSNADDIAYYQHAMQLVRRLELLNIPFEFQSYPNEPHDLKGVSPHVYGTINRFWTNCFNGGASKKAYFSLVNVLIICLLGQM